MPGATREQILAALKAVDSGTGGLDVVARGWVKDVLTKDGHVTVTLDVPAKLGPQLEPVRAAAEKMLQKMSGVVSATVVLTAAAEKAAPQPGHGAGAKTR